MKLNPYEQGQADFKNGLKISCNPFPVFSARWAQYNRGFNTASGWPLPGSDKRNSGRRDGSKPA